MPSSARWFVFLPLPIVALHLASCVGDEPEVGGDAGATTDGGTGPGNDGGGTDGSSSVDAGSSLDAADADAEVDAGPAYVFLTAGKYRGGDLGGLAGADAKCAAEAAKLGLGQPGKYVAWLSTSTVNAINRITPTGGPWLRRQDGAVVIGNRSQLAGGGGVSVSVALGGTDIVWTSTTKDGEAVYLDTMPRQYQTCKDWTSVSSADYGYGGEAAKTGEAWTYGVSSTCDVAFSIYCLRSE